MSLRPTILGILNLTPDSFSDGGEFLLPDRALAQARALQAGGATHLDVGAESTRPGAAAVTEDEEWARLEPVLRLLRTHLPDLPLSLDCRHASVVARALPFGISVLNDVTGFEDPAMREVARTCNAQLLAMRSRPAPGGTFLMPPYDGPGETTADRAVAELRGVRDRLLAEGFAPERIVLDPGFGFGTTWTEDRAIWEALPDLPRLLEWPVEGICIALSRKRFTAWMAGQPDLPPTHRDLITRQLHGRAHQLGYGVFRTHSVPCFLEPHP